MFCKKKEFLLFIIYLIIISIGSHFHEFWRDEILAWQIAFHSNNLIDIIENIKWEGHPPLWHICIFFVQKLSISLTAFKVLHLFIASINAWLIIRYSGMSFFEKILILSSYFFIYEYSVVNRNYAIGITFLLLGTILFTKKWYNLFYVSLGISCFSSLIVMILSIAFSATTVFFFIKNKMPFKKYRFGLLIFIFSVILSLKITSGSENLIGIKINEFNSLSFNEKLERLNNRIEKANETFFSPFFKSIQLNDFKESINGLSSTQYKLLTNIKRICTFSFYFFFVSWIVQFLFSGLYRGKEFILFFGLSLLGCFIFFSFIYYGHNRHWGLVLVSLMITVWLFNYFNIYNKWLKLALLPLVLCQIIFGLFALREDLLRPASYLENVINFLKSYEKQKLVIAGSPDFIINPISDLTDIAVFTPQKGVEEKTFIKWGERPDWMLNDSAGFNKVELYFQNKEKDKTKLFIYSGEKMPYLTDNFKLIKAFNNPSSITGEDFYIYEWKEEL